MCQLTITRTSHHALHLRLCEVGNMNTNMGFGNMCGLTLPQRMEFLRY